MRRNESIRLSRTASWIYSSFYLFSFVCLTPSSLASAPLSLVLPLRFPFSFPRPTPPSLLRFLHPSLTSPSA